MRPISELKLVAFPLGFHELLDRSTSDETERGGSVGPGVDVDLASKSVAEKSSLFEKRRKRRKKGQPSSSSECL